MKHPIRRRLMYLGFRAVQALARWFPLAVAQLVGRALGMTAYVVLRAQRRLTHHHLAYAFGASLKAAQRRRIARRVFMNLGQTGMEWLVLPRLSCAAIQRLVTCEGLGHLQQALQQGSGAIILSPHFGNWELMSLYLRSLGFEGGVVARRLRYPEYEHFLIDQRGTWGIPTIARGSVREVTKLLRGNQIVGVMPDQDIDTLEGVFVEFFGHPAYTPVGPASLALMTGATILPCFLVRDGRRFRLLIEEPIPLSRSEDRSRDLVTVTQAWSRVVESYIRRYPDQWVWMHRRWKTQPPNQNTEHGVASSTVACAVT